MRFLGDFKQRRMVIPPDVSGTPTGPIFKGKISAWILIIRSKGFPETSVRKYDTTVRNIPEECRSHINLFGGPKSRC